MAVSEEEVIRNRLLFDGEGTGDDRRIQTLMKTIVKWCHSDASQEESSLTYQKIVALLSQCEYSMVKNHLVYEMNIIERKNYEVKSFFCLNETVEHKWTGHFLTTLADFVSFFRYMEGLAT